MSEIPPVEDPRKVLQRHGFAPKKSFSQNFLVNASVVQRIADQVVRDDLAANVVELGPGAGTLTGELLRRGARVHAVEHDQDMITLLTAEFPAIERLQVVEGDAATVDLLALSRELFSNQRIVVCGNLPYSITGQIFRNLFHQHGAIQRAIFMVQKEVADRLVATPGTKTYGALSACIRALFAVKTAFRVSRGSFFPVPNVDSAVVVLTPLAQPVCENLAGYERTVRLSFGKRRKTLLNALQDGFEKEHVVTACAAANIDPIRRGETLTPEEFAALTVALG